MTSGASNSSGAVPGAGSSFAPTGRVLWLAVADARGHLMRAHIAKQVLAARGIEVDIYTTTQAGVAFLRKFGTEAKFLNDHFGVVYDGKQDMDKWGTERKTLAYLLLPTRMLNDMRWFGQVGKRYDFVVDDSFLPSLLLQPISPFMRDIRVVHVYGKYMREAVAGQFEGGRWAKQWDDFYSKTINDMCDRAFARVEHTFDVADEGEREAMTWRLPPLIPMPTRTPEEVRASLGVAADQKLAVVYLNPNFNVPEIAAAVEHAFADKRWKLHAVGEGYAGRPGWIAQDTRLGEAIMAADVLVSAPGMGALAQARLFHTPLLAVVTDQPEQRRNLKFLEDADHPTQNVALAELSTLPARMASGLASLEARTADGGPRPSALEAVQARQKLWADAFAELVALARR